MNGMFRPFHQKGLSSGSHRTDTMRRVQIRSIFIRFERFKVPAFAASYRHFLGTNVCLMSIYHCITVLLLLVSSVYLRYHLADVMHISNVRCEIEQFSKLFQLSKYHCAFLSSVYYIPNPIV